MREFLHLCLRVFYEREKKKHALCISFNLILDIIKSYEYTGMMKSGAIVIEVALIIIDNNILINISCQTADPWCLRATPQKVVCSIIDCGSYVGGKN